MSGFPMFPDLKRHFLFRTPDEVFGNRRRIESVSVQDVDSDLRQLEFDVLSARSAITSKEEDRKPIGKGAFIGFWGEDEYVNESENEEDQDQSEAGIVAFSPPQGLDDGPVSLPYSLPHMYSTSTARLVQALTLSRTNASANEDADSDSGGDADESYLSDGLEFTDEDTGNDVSPVSRNIDSLRIAAGLDEQPSDLGSTLAETPSGSGSSVEQMDVDNNDSAE